MTRLSFLGDIAFVAGIVIALFAAPLLVAMFHLATPMRRGLWLSGASVILLLFAAVAGGGGYGLIRGPETFQSTIAQVAALF